MSFNSKTTISNMKGCKGTFGFDEEKFNGILEDIFRGDDYKEDDERRDAVVAEFGGFPQIREWLKKKLSGDHEKAVIYLFATPYQRVAMALHHAMNGRNDDTVIALVLVTLDKTELNEAKKEYQEIYGKNLFDQLRGETSGSFGDVVDKILDVNPGELKDLREAVDNDNHPKNQAVRLRQAFDGVNNDSVIKGVFGNYTRQHLIATRTFYTKLYGRDLRAAIENELGGSYGLICAFRVMNCRELGAVAAKVAHRSDDKLIEMISTLSHWLPVNAAFLAEHTINTGRRAKEELSKDAQVAIQHLCERYDGNFFMDA